MDILYLDQNKWIELAQVHVGKVAAGPIARLCVQLSIALERERVLFPLSVSHVLETSKRNGTVSRRWVAETQAKLSRGYVYRSRTGHLEVEIRAALHRLFGSEPLDLPINWAIARGFLQAFEPTDELNGRLTNYFGSCG